MQIHTEERFELTVTRDREDYRKIVTLVSYRSWGPWQSSTFALLILAMLVSLMTEQLWTQFSQGTKTASVIQPPRSQGLRGTRFKPRDRQRSRALAQVHG